MYDDSLLRERMSNIEHDFEELKNDIKQLRQTLMARYDRLDNRVCVVESVALPKFNTADEDLEEE